METKNSDGLNDSKDPRLERLRALEMKRLNALGLKDWTETDRQELLGLYESLNKPVVMTQEHRDAIKHQNTAGIGDSPLLTDAERKLIHGVNFVNK